MNSKLHLIDLAGSERVEKTGSLGSLQKEASHINRSLTFLEQVVIALTQSKRDHIPYRQSKLTYLLKDSLGGNSHTFMIACIWPHINHGWESLSTLRFAARMKNIENQPVRNNLISKEPVSAKLVLQVDQLKRELMMRDIITGNDAWLPELNKMQRARTIRATCTIASTYNSSSSSPSSSFSSFSLTHDKIEEVSKEIEGSRDNFKECSSDISHLNKTHEDHSLDLIEMNVKSLSHVRLITGTMKALLWEACGYDKNKIEEVCKTVMRKYEIDKENQIVKQQVGLLQKPEKDCLGTGTGTGTGLEDVSEGDDMNMDNEKNNLDFNSVSSPSSTSLSTHTPIPVSVPVPSITFDEFITTPKGIPLFIAYENTKNDLNQNKLSQRKITILLNNLKSMIDSLQDEQQQQNKQKFEEEREEEEEEEEESKGEDENENGDEDVENVNDREKRKIINDNKNDSNDNDNESEGYNKIIECSDTKIDLKKQKETRTEREMKSKTHIKTEIKMEIGMEINSKLVAAKKEYRMTSKELDLCRFQTKEIQDLKKVALANLLKSFENEIANPSEIT